MGTKDSAGLRFRQAVKDESPLQVVGAINAYHAILAEKSGYKAIYLSGGGVAAGSLGVPDLGITTLEDILVDARRITDASALPLLVDIDTGFGGAFNIGRTIKSIEKAGAGAIHIEDQVLAKRCGHRPNKSIVSKDEMVNRIKAAVDAREDNNFVIIARTDAFAVEGLNSALDRAKACEEAGADMIFPEAMKDESEFEKVRKVSRGYLLANMTEFGKSKLFNYKELEQFGYNIVIYPVTTQRLAMKSVEDGLRDIYANGHQNNIIDKMQTRKRLYELVDYEKYNSLDEKIYNFNTDGHE